MQVLDWAWRRPWTPPTSPQHAGSSAYSSCSGTVPHATPTLDWPEQVPDLACVEEDRGVREAADLWHIHCPVRADAGSNMHGRAQPGPV